MNASDLVDRLADRMGLTRKAARACLGVALDEIVHALARGERVTLSGFGTFEVRHRAERPGHHPKTGVRLAIHAHRSAGFRTGAALRRALQASVEETHLGRPADGGQPD